MNRDQDQPAIEGIVVVHFDEEGDLSYRVYGDERVRLFIVDERAPNDRVYEWTAREPAEGFREMVPAGEVIGSSADERHAAIEARILAIDSGKRHLAIASQGKDRNGGEG